MMVVRTLSFHAPYRCANSGVCCTSGWPIPVESDRVDIVVGHLPAKYQTRPLTLLPLEEHRCVLHDATLARCRLHEAAGHEALPLACRQFPRVTVVDPRGASVTLSHYCPTARALLDDDAAIAIVEDAERFPTSAEYEGLDVRGPWPPLLRDAMLMDWSSWWLWEARSIAVIADFDGTPELALGALANAAAQVRRWRPVDGPLDEAIDRAFEAARRAPRQWTVAADVTQGWMAALQASVPAGLRSGVRPSLPAPPPTARVLSRYLAAHAFANWAMHLGGGLDAWLASIQLAYVAALTYGIGDADLLIRHFADPRETAAIRPA
jgi:hypothetical protein